MAPEAALTVNVIVVELTTVKLEAEVVPCLTAAASVKLVPVIVTVLPKTAELGVLTFELANEEIAGNEFVVTVEDSEDSAEFRKEDPFPIAVIVILYAVFAESPVIADPEVNEVMADPTSVVPSEAK